MSIFVRENWDKKITCTVCLLAQIFLIRFVGYIVELLKGHTVKKKFRDESFAPEGFTLEWNVLVDMWFSIGKM